MAGCRANSVGRLKLGDGRDFLTKPGQRVYVTLENVFTTPRAARYWARGVGNTDEDALRRNGDRTWLVRPIGAPHSPGVQVGSYRYRVIELVRDVTDEDCGLPLPPAAPVDALQRIRVATDQTTVHRLTWRQSEVDKLRRIGHGLIACQALVAPLLVWSWELSRDIDPDQFVELLDRKWGLLRWPLSIWLVMLIVSAGMGLLVRWRKRTLLLAQPDDLPQIRRDASFRFWAVTGLIFTFMVLTAAGLPWASTTIRTVTLVAVGSAAAWTISWATGKYSYRVPSSVPKDCPTGYVETFRQ